MQRILKNIIRDEDGATMAEYALLVTFIAIAALGAVQLFGNAVNTKMTANAYAIR